MPEPRVSVVIVTYNSADVIGECVRSLAHNVDLTDTEVVVVDNASVDETVQVVRNELPSARLEVSGENLGFAGGSNRGAALSSGRYVMLLNPDTVVVNNALQRLADLLDADDSMWAVGPTVLDTEHQTGYVLRRSADAAMGAVRDDGG